MLKAALRPSNILTKNFPKGSNIFLIEVNILPIFFPVFETPLVSIFDKLSRPDLNTLMKSVKNVEFLIDIFGKRTPTKFYPILTLVMLKLPAINSSLKSCKFSVFSFKPKV